MEEGIHYCEERDLDSLDSYMLSWIESRMYPPETGNWNEAYKLHENLIKNEEQPPPTKIGPLVVVATIKIRRGRYRCASVIAEVKEKAFETRELTKNYSCYFSALLEYEWITGTS